MKRQFHRLWGVAPPSPHFNSGDVEDGFVHFFQDAYHLKDWLKNDPETSDLVQNDIELFVNDSETLSLVADLANGSKHLKLNRTRTGDTTTSARSIQISGDPMQGLNVSLRVSSRGKTRDGVELAREAIDEWISYLDEKGLQRDS